MPVSAEAIGWVYRFSPYVGAAFAVHLAMADSANDQHGNEVWTADETTARKARVSIGTVRRAHAQMREDGLIELVDRAAGDVNRWRLLMPSGVQLAFAYPARGARGNGPTPAHGARGRARGARQNPREPKSSPNGERTAAEAAVPEGEINPIQMLVGDYVDDYARVCNGAEPPREWKAVAGREARKALANGETVEHVGACLQVIADERKSPATLPHVIADSHAGAERRKR